MKFLTLNTHSWMEKNPEEKFQLLFQDILENSYDLICFQEINQEITSTQVESGRLYNPLPSAEPIHQDHYVRLLVEKLSEKGLDYYWTWAYNHIGFDIYNEGVAILSRKPIAPREVLVSEVNDPRDYHTRKVLLAETEVEGQLMTIASCHLSWWDKGFQGEWSKLEEELLKVKTPLVLMGDFNNPVDYEGYQHILKSPLKLQDSHKVAQKISGRATVEGEIAGWDGNQDALKIDYIFTSRGIQIESSAVVFDGKETPVVSDHFGLEVEAKF